jgi:spore maturation protein CgeB
VIPSLRFSFFASSLVSSYWNGAATYYRGIVRALASRGHRVTFYEPDLYERQRRHRDLTNPSWAEVIHFRADDESSVLACLERAATNSDVLIKGSGIGVYDQLLEDAIPSTAKPRTTTIFWDVDAPATLERIHRDEDDPLRAAVARYDLVFTFGGGDGVVHDYAALGARSCTPIYNAVDPESHFPVSPNARYSSSLALLADRLPDRDARVDEFFFRPAERLLTQEFLLGGSGWTEKSLPANVRAIGHVPTHDHNAFNVTPLAVLDVARGSTAKYRYSPAPRVFEAAGAAACVVVDAWEGVDTFLEPGREVLVAEDGDRVVSILSSLSSERAHIIGENARRRVLAEHTYAMRALQVESILLVRTRQHGRLSA